MNLRFRKETKHLVKSLIVIILGMLLFCECRCESGEEKISGGEKINGEIVSVKYGSGYDSWQEAYGAYITESYCEGNEFKYSLIYLDEDAQPELYVETNSSAGGEQVLTFYKNELNILKLSRLGSKHIPGKGLIYNNCGHMDYYPVYIYKLYEGAFYKIREGIWGGLDWKDGFEFTEEGELDYQYEWEGERYSEQEFYSEIDKIFPRDEGIHPEEWYTYQEMLEILKDG